MSCAPPYPAWHLTTHQTNQSLISPSGAQDEDWTEPLIGGLTRTTFPLCVSRTRPVRPVSRWALVADPAPAIHDARSGNRSMTAGTASVCGVRRPQHQDGSSKQDCNENHPHVHLHDRAIPTVATGNLRLPL